MLDGHRVHPEVLQEGAHLNKGHVSTNPGPASMCTIFRLKFCKHSLRWVSKEQRQLHGRLRHGVSCCKGTPQQ